MNFSSKYFLNILIIFALVYKSPRVSTIDVNIDYLILSILWPPTSCMYSETKGCSVASDSISPDVITNANNNSTWTLHGLW